MKMIRDNIAGGIGDDNDMTSIYDFPATMNKLIRIATMNHFTHFKFELQNIQWVKKGKSAWLFARLCLIQGEDIEGAKMIRTDILTLKTFDLDGYYLESNFRSQREWIEKQCMDYEVWKNGE